MEERNNKSNTMLLTVIAIATLLVAVIGATFAYFTASIDRPETESTVLVQGTTLTINFQDDTPNVGLTQGLVPRKDLTAVTSKEFSLVATNPSTATVKYSLYLVVTKNSFALQDAGKTSLTYSLTRTSNTTGDGKGEVANATKQNIPVYDLTNLEKASGGTKGSYVIPTGKENEYASLQTVQMVGTATYTHRLHGDLQNRGTNDGTQVYGIKLGTGSIAPSDVDANSQLTHSYRLDIFFDENTKNQDYDKDSVFEGYVAIDADAITPAA